jgi:hypothetical protein
MVEWHGLSESLVLGVGHLCLAEELAAQMNRAGTIVNFPSVERDNHNTIDIHKSSTTTGNKRIPATASVGGVLQHVLSMHNTSDEVYFRNRLCCKALKVLKTRFHGP